MCGGHAYEFDVIEGMSWEIFEEFSKLISRKSDIIYSTNKEVFLEWNLI